MLVDGEVWRSWGRCYGSWGGVTVVRKCNSYQGGVKVIRMVCQLKESCDGYVGMKGT